MKIDICVYFDLDKLEIQEQLLEQLMHAPSDVTCLWFGAGSVTSFWTVFRI